MRQVVHSSKLMCHGMHIAKTGRIERHASQELRVRHHVAGLDILPILHCRRQIGTDQLHGPNGAGIGHRVTGSGDISFDGMGQGVHSGGRCQGFRHANHCFGVIHGQGWSHAPIHNGHLHVTRLIGDDAKARHLSTRPGGGVDCHHSHHRFRALIHALHLTNVPTIGGRQSNGLGTIMRGTTAERNHEVTVLLLDLLQSSLNLSTCWVWFTAIVDGICDARLIQGLRERLHGTHFHQDCIGDDQSLLVT
mmetsp:Transcript_38006/g.81732  ORF Transcript_38006/g.81732 Transcript_38006/m.81732 type:complete len:249 (-) Transcript_38006:248-994(-)